MLQFLLTPRAAAGTVTAVGKTWTAPPLEMPSAGLPVPAPGWSPRRIADPRFLTSCPVDWLVAVRLGCESARAHGGREPLPVLTSASDRSHESYQARGILVCRPCQLPVKEDLDWCGGSSPWPTAL